MTLDWIDYVCIGAIIAIVVYGMYWNSDWNY